MEGTKVPEGDQTGDLEVFQTGPGSTNAEPTPKKKKGKKGKNKGQPSDQNEPDLSESHPNPADQETQPPNPGEGMDSNDTKEVLTLVAPEEVRTTANPTQISGTASETTKPINTKTEVENGTEIQNEGLVELKTATNQELSGDPPSPERHPETKSTDTPTESILVPEQTLAIENQAVIPAQPETLVTQTDFQTQEPVVQPAQQHVVETGVDTHLPTETNQANPPAQQVAETAPMTVSEQENMQAGPSTGEISQNVTSLQDLPPKDANHTTDAPPAKQLVSSASLGEQVSVTETTPRHMKNGGTEDVVDTPAAPVETGSKGERNTPSPKKAKVAKTSKEDYLLVKGFLDKQLQKVAKAETSKKSKISQLQDVLKAVEELNRKISMEGKNREVDKAAKEALLQQMQAEYEKILKQIDNPQKNTAGPVMKESVFKKQVECRKDELQKKLDELKSVQTAFSERLRLQREISAQHKQGLRLSREVEKISSQIMSLQQREKDVLERLKTSGSNFELEKARVEGLIHQDTERTVTLQREDEQISKAIEEAVSASKKLEGEIECLRREEFNSKEKFESDNKFNKDECARLRKELALRDAEYEKMQQDNISQSHRCTELREEITQTVASIKEMLVASKSQLANNSSVQRFEKAQKEALEKLLHEKNELKGEVDRLTREHGKLTVINKDLAEVLAVREGNLSLLLEFLAELDHSDRMSVERDMTTNLNAKGIDIKKLVKHTVGRNIELRYELERLERECLQSSVDIGEV